MDKIEKDFQDLQEENENMRKEIELYLYNLSIPELDIKHIFIKINELINKDKEINNLKDNLFAHSINFTREDKDFINSLLSPYKKSLEDFVRELKEELKKGKKEDAWGYEIFEADYEGLIKIIDALAKKHGIGDKNVI